jgi:hypothetical protein
MVIAVLIFGPKAQKLSTIFAAVNRLSIAHQLEEERMLNFWATLSVAYLQFSFQVDTQNFFGKIRCQILISDLM